jgi:hypothetical protein
MLGLSHIAWALRKVTKGDDRAKFMWGKEQQREFYDLNNLLCSSPLISLVDLQKSFNIETNAFDYVVGAILNQHGYLVAYHSETLSNTIWKYPTYDKEMYSIVQCFLQLKNYNMGKERIIHTIHKPLQFIQTQEKL